jgi:hypothetical protein
MATETQPSKEALIATENQLTAENAMRAARTIGAHIIIARYNYASEQEVNRRGGHETARNAALTLFPFAEASKSLSQVEGAQTVHTFKAPFFDRLPDNFFSLPLDDQDRIARSVIAELGEKNLGIGWVAVIDHNSYESFIKQMGGRNGPLWAIFDIDEIVLNDDQTTNDIYLLMTPRSWN